MPITCQRAIRSVDTDQFGELDYKVMRHCFDAHNDLGRLPVETVFQHDVAARLLAAGYNVAREVEVIAAFGTFSKSFLLDLVVGDWGVYEFKSVAALTLEHETQLLNYLRLLNIAHGKLVNFRGKSVESKFVNSDKTRIQRTQFEVDQSRFTGEASFVSLVESLLRDWGTGLSLSLYRDALAHLLRSDVDVLQSVAMQRQGTSIGQQPFLLSAPDRAWRLTAFCNLTDEYGRALQKLIQHSQLSAIDWVNIDLDRMTFRTVCR